MEEKLMQIRIEEIKVNDNIKGIRTLQNEEAIGRYMEKYENGTTAPILVKMINDRSFVLVDGHHRIEALRRLDRRKVDAKIVDASDDELYDLAVSSNREHGVPLTKAEEEAILVRLVEAGRTQEQIAKIFNLSQQTISKRINSNKSLVLQLSGKIKLSTINEILSGKMQVDVAKLYDISTGRVSQIYGDFKNSIIESYNTGTTKEDIISKANKEGIQLTHENLNMLVPEDYNKLIIGDCLTELPKLDDEIVDCVIIDAPYGMNYQSNLRIEKHEEIINDNKDAFELLDKSLGIVFNKMKKNSHIYIFTSWKVIDKVKPIVEKHFMIKTCIVWNKTNWGMGDLNTYAEKYELILFAVKGNRPLYCEMRPSNVIDAGRTDNSLHPTQKPTDLLRHFVRNSTKKGELVLDYFAGSNSTGKASQEEGRRWIGIDIKDWNKEE